MKVDLSVVNVLSELERMGWSYEPIGKDELRLLCPAHEDTNPSAAMSVSSGLWKCHSCNATGDIATFMSHALKSARGYIIHDLASRYDIKQGRIFSRDTIEKYHAEIFKAGPLLQALYDRGITEETIRIRRLGYFDGRITIPVFDSGGNCIQVRRYLPGAPGPEKMRNTKGYTSVALYPIDQLKYDTLWFCGGEMKALAAAQQLNAKGIGAFCVTAGESTWDHEFSALIKGKKVVICMDVDDKGVKANATLGRQLSIHCDVSLVKLPLDIEKYPHGDINDFVMAGGLLADLTPEPYIHPKDEQIDRPVRDMSLVEAYKATNVAQDIRFSGEINAIDETPFLIPKRVRVFCGKDQKNCAICPVHSMPFNDRGYVEMQIPTLTQATFELSISNRKKMDDDVRNCLTIPTCRSVQFKVDEWQSAWEVRVGHRLSLDVEHQAASSYPALTFTPTVELNAPYKFTGRLYPHPKNLAAYFLIGNIQEEEDSLNSYHVDPEGLEIFQPREWSHDALVEKLDAIYSDIEANTTRIFGRRNLHLAIDMVYHSPILFEFDGRLTPGWTNLLVVGDSAQGKSETTTRLQAFYGLGEIVECKNASVAGLLGGVQQMSGRWFVSWGVIPQHDRRLVVLEEVKGAPVEVISRLTDMRSRGVAEIPKIERRRAMARTRMIWISNPRSPKPLSAFNFGVDAIKELIGGLEDIRRFDLALVLSQDAMTAESIQTRKTTRVLDGRLCKRLILWAWTRRATEITFEPEAIALIHDSLVLCEKYSDSIPLVDKGTIRQKIARLSAGLAGRTFSVQNDNLLVRRCHVEYVIRWMQRVYDDPFHGYKDFSLSERDARGELGDVTKYVETNLRHPDVFIRCILAVDRISFMDIMDWCEVNREPAQMVISNLVRLNALARDKQEYIKTPAFIEYLKQPREFKRQHGDF